MSESSCLRVNQRYSNSLMQIYQFLARFSCDKLTVLFELQHPFESGPNYTDMVLQVTCGLAAEPNNRQQQTGIAGLQVTAGYDRVA